MASWFSTKTSSSKPLDNATNKTLKSARQPRKAKANENPSETESSRPLIGEDRPEPGDVSQYSDGAGQQPMETMQLVPMQTKSTKSVPQVQGQARSQEDERQPRKAGATENPSRQEKLLQSLVCDERHERGVTSQRAASAGQQPTGAVQAVPMQKKSTKLAPQAPEAKGDAQERDKVSHPFKDEQRNPSRKFSSKSEECWQECVQECPENAEASPSTIHIPLQPHIERHRPSSSAIQAYETECPLREQPGSTHGAEYGKDGPSLYACPCAVQAQTASREIASIQIADWQKRYEALLRDHKFVQGELQAKISRLDKKDGCIRSLEAEITELRQSYDKRFGPPSLQLIEKDNSINALEAKVTNLQRSYDEQEIVLSSVRHELESCHSQLDNMQRFVSTADIHADQDIIRKLQKLNEVVYQTSMTMADYVAEGFTRRIVAESRTNSQIPDRDTCHVLLADVHDNDIALFLQIAFQDCFACALCQIASMWTIDQKLNTMLEETYQSLRRAGTQAISGRWRSLTRAHILPTSTSELESMTRETIARLSDIVMEAGFGPSKSDVEAKLLVAFGEKVFNMVSLAGKFGNMVAEMVSGDFEVFVVQPGEAFEGERMMDMFEGSESAARLGTGAAQTVLCVTRLGLRKRMGEEMITLTKAEVVLRSLLD